MKSKRMKTKLILSMLLLAITVSAQAAPRFALENVVVAYDKGESESGIYYHGYVKEMGELFELDLDPSCNHLFNQNEKVFCRSASGAPVQVGITTEEISTEGSDGVMKVRWSSNVELQETHTQPNRTWFKLVLRN